VLNGVFWVLGTARNGAKCRRNIPRPDLPPRLQQWVRNGKLEEALKLLARYLHERGRLNLEEAFVDATFASAKKGALPSGPTRRGEGKDRRCRR
jgi:hypothetical protein